MPVHLDAVVDLLERAAADRQLHERLVAHPLETALREGIHIDVSDVKHLLAIPAATDEELFEVLRRRFQVYSLRCAPCGTGDPDEVPIIPDQ